MSNEKKPSIYQDRGTIGSVRELDEYGVWVKSEPQDLVSGEANSGEDDFSLDKLPDFPADFDSSSDLDDSDFSIPEGSFNTEDSEETGEEGIDELGDLPDFSIDDFSDDFSLSEEDSGKGEEDLSLDGGEDFSLNEAESGAGFSLGDADFSLDEEDLDLSLPEDTPIVEAAAPEEESPESPDSDEGFDEISLEDLLGGVADELPGEESPEEEGTEDPPPSDKSTRLLMKIAEELSSIRAELSALKQEFSAVRGTEGEGRGFFDDTDTDDKIALTGDELNNILNTADFTEETGSDAAEGALPDFSEGDTPGASEGVSPEISADELSLDDLAELEEPAGELELPAEAEEPIEFGELPELDQPEEPEPELSTESPEDVDLSAELSLVDLSDDSISADFSIESPGNGGDDGEIGELSPEESAVILEESAGDEGTEDSGEPDISLDMPFSGEEISLENFDEEALDLSGAVIEEPDLGAEIQENPLLEPTLDDIAMFDEDLGKEDAELSLEVESPPEPSTSPDGEETAEILEEPALSPLEEVDLPPEEVDSPLEEIGGDVEIPGTEEKEGPPARARGEDLDQIIPEGFVIEEPDDEGAGFGDLDSLEEGISLDEIPEIVLPEEDEAVEQGTAVEGPEEPEVSALPGNFKTELKQVLSYMDQLLESLPEEKIEEFAKSEYFDTYKKLFKDLGLA
jgi:hypothetical protein